MVDSATQTDHIGTLPPLAAEQNEFLQRLRAVFTEVLQQALSSLGGSVPVDLIDKSLTRALQSSPPLIPVSLQGLSQGDCKATPAVPTLATVPDNAGALEMVDSPDEQDVISSDNDPPTWQTVEKTVVKTSHAVGPHGGTKHRVKKKGSRKQRLSRSASNT